MKTVRKALEHSDIPSERHALCAELSHGSLSRALQMGGDAVWEKRKMLYRFLEKPESEINPLVDWAAKDASNLTLLVDQMENLSADCLAWSLSDKTYHWKNQDGVSILKRYTERHGKSHRDFWVQRSMDLAKLRSISDAPLNRKVLIQNMLMGWVS